MKIAVISPKCVQESAKYIAEQLKLWYDDVTYYNPYQQQAPKSFDLVVNYGCSSSVPLCKRINDVYPVATAIDKLATFTKIPKELRVVWTSKKEQAKKWIMDGHHVAIRETAIGTQGKGLSITNKIEDIDNKPAVFYTKYVHHTNELRINCFKNKVLTVLDKQDVFGNFLFKLLRKFEHPQLQTLVDTIYTNIGLDMYGIDALLDNNGNLVMLEVNSGPMLFGQTGIQMVQAIHKEIEDVSSRR